MSPKKEEFADFLTSLWAIWNSRNAFLFDSRPKGLQHELQLAVTYLKEFRKCNVDSSMPEVLTCVEETKSGLCEDQF